MANRDSTPKQTKQVQGSAYVAFALIVLTAALGGLTQNIMNTAMAECIADINVDITQGQLLTTIFPLCMGVTVPVVAFLTKRYSERHLCTVAMAIFLGGTLIISFGQDFYVLMAGRILQSIAAGITVPLAQIVVFKYFPEERWGLLVGFSGIAMGFAPSVGPTIAGIFTTQFGWRSCFYFLSVLSVLLLVLILITVKQISVGARPPKLDWPSFFLSCIGFGGLLTGLSAASSAGFASIACLAPLIIGAITLIFFTYRQYSIEQPLLDLHVFENRQYVVGTIVGVLLFGAFSGLMLTIPLHLQTQCGYSALDAGLVLLPTAFIAIVLNPLSGALLDKFGFFPVATVSLTAQTIGTAMLLNLGYCDDLVYISFWQCVRSFGISGLIPALCVWFVQGLPKALISDGTSLGNVLRQVASSLGTAVTVLCLASFGGSISPEGVNLSMVFTMVLTVGMLGTVLWTWFSDKRRS